MHSWLDGSPHSNRGVGIDLDGSSTTASLEGGYPTLLAPGLALEPQAQILWQTVDFDPSRDLFSLIGFDPDDALSGRIGARLLGTYALGETCLRPYLKANLWR